MPDIFTYISTQMLENDNIFKRDCHSNIVSFPTVFFIHMKICLTATTKLHVESKEGNSFPVLAHQIQISLLRTIILYSNTNDEY